MSQLTNTKNCAVDTFEFVIQETDNFTKILSVDKIKQRGLYWGGNGVGGRWAKQKFNYSTIYSKQKPSLYSENDDDSIPPDVLSEFLQTNKNKGTGIIGIFVHSIRTNIQKRPIDDNIRKKIRSLSCVVCGTNKTVCDHKNDLYNDSRVLNSETQVISDFQPLCNHCNLQKKEVCRKEERTQKIYSAKNIQRYKIYPFEFPWEKKVFDKNDINCKNGTFWFDPVEFDTNIYYYSIYVFPIVKEIKYKIKTNKLILIA